MQATPGFKDEAPGYFAAGFGAVPVWPGEKGTRIPGWQNYASAPPEGEQQAWLEKYAGYGIGLVMGKVLANSNVLAAIDVDDGRLERFAKAIKGPSASGRFGSKGVAFFVQLESGVDSAQFKLANGGVGIEVLAAKKMVALPPTIHPKTHKPYEWRGAPLLACDPTTFPVWSASDLMLVKKVLARPELLEILSGKGTHGPTVAICQVMAGFSIGKDAIVRLATTLFPPGYSGTTLDELDGIVDWAMAHAFDDAPKKPPTPLEKLIKWGTAQHLYLDPVGDPYLSINKEINDESL